MGAAANFVGRNPYRVSLAPLIVVSGLDSKVAGLQMDLINEKEILRAS